MRERADTGQPFHGLLDRTFEVGIIVKGLDGLVELVAGIVLLGVTPTTINRVADHLTRGDPEGFLARHILSSAHHLHGATLLFTALYLLSHGVVKVVLVAALLKNKLWAYPWMIGFLVLFTLYQLYALTRSFGAGLTLLTVFDVLIIWLTWREWRKQLAERDEAVTSGSEA